MTKAGKLYLQIAKAALDEWYPDVSERAKQRLLGEANYDLLETSYVNGHDAISEGVISLRKSLKKKAITLPRGFTDYVKYGGGFDSAAVRTETVDLTEAEKAEITLTALEAIHDRWVRGNSAQFFDAAKISRRYMFLPMPMIGFKETCGALIFLEPILRELGLEAPEQKLKEAYVERVVIFRNAHKLTSLKAVTSYVMSELYTYKALDATIYKHLNNRYQSAEELANQAVEKMRADGFMFVI